MGPVDRRTVQPALAEDPVGRFLAAHPTSAQLKAAQTFVSNGHKAVRPSIAGGYVSYRESGRSVSTYYGANYPRLQTVKKKYDPTGFFHNAYTIV